MMDGSWSGGGGICNDQRSPASSIPRTVISHTNGQMEMLSHPLYQALINSSQVLTLIQMLIHSSVE